MTLVDRIEKLIGEERSAKLTSNRAYRFIVDGLANNLFSVVYGLNEKILAGMSWEEIGKARVAAFFGNMVVGRPYGIYRDWAMGKMGILSNVNTSGQKR